MDSAYRPRRRDDRVRSRRTCLSVPGSSRKMIDKAKGLPADEVFLDLEDAVAAEAKARARSEVAAALAEPGWAGQLRGVRVIGFARRKKSSEAIDAENSKTQN